MAKKKKPAKKAKVAKGKFGGSGNRSFFAKQLSKMSGKKTSSGS
jgi:hypothetical protein